MYPGSVTLNDSVKSANPCSRVLFYLTWGRRFGGIQCFTPNYCSPDFTGYNQMQDSLTLAYKRIADSLSGWIAPVGEAWRFVISNTAMVLHDADNSHPNLNGSYLAACVFYNVIFGKPSSGNSFTAGLAADTALFLQQAADSVTFGYSAQWNLNNDAPHAAFSFTTSGDTLFTRNLSTLASSWLWDSGNGQTSTLSEPFFVYHGPGTWTIKLRACNDCFCDSTQQDATFAVTGDSEYSSNDKSIRLVGPDRDGLITLPNFNENGTLMLYDISGNSPVILRVNAGHANTRPLSKSLWIWKLTNLRNEIVARGKFIQ
jgi:hypothetical protein